MSSRLVVAHSEACCRFLPCARGRLTICLERTNPAFSYFRHFRRFRGSEEPSPCFQWVECEFVILAVFVKTAPFLQGTKTLFTKNTVCATPTSVSKSLPSARKRLQIKNLDLFSLAFVMERQINSPRCSFAFAFVVIMLGTHKPQQQATLKK